MIQPSWKDFFLFSNKEIKGIIALGVILLGSVCIKFLFPASTLESKKMNATIPHLFNFDPNTIDSLHAIALGIPEKQVSNLMHYRARGGRFKDKEAFAKLYGLTPSLYASIKPYIIIGNTENMGKQTVPKAYPYKKEGKIFKESYTWKININEASEMEWRQKTLLPEYLIQRIVAYKKYRGAFLKPSELAKIYGLSDTIYQSLREHLVVINNGKYRLNANAMQFNDWKELGMFTEPQIWRILKLKRINEGLIYWQTLVEALDLTKEEAISLQSKVRFNEPAQ